MDFTDPEDVRLDELPKGFTPGPLWDRMSELDKRIEVAAWLDRRRRNELDDRGSWNGRRW